MEAAASVPAPSHNQFANKEKPIAVRISNIIAAKSVADVIRTSLGPRGMDKMIRTGKGGETIITNDGATILKHMSVLHPCSKMLVELSAAQDVVAGDGTTSVVVIAGALLGAAEKLLEKGIHPSIISDSFKLASHEAIRILKEMSIPVKMDDKETILKSATTSLSSKVVAPYGNLIARMAVDAVLKVADLSKNHVDLRDVRIVKRVGGTIDDCELVEGLLLNQSVTLGAGGPSRVEKAKIGLIQFQLSPPKTDMEGAIVINDYQQMDRILAEERAYLLNLCKKIKKANCNVLLIQKSILRDAVSEMALQYLAKLKILTVINIEREEVEFIAKTIGCRPIADIESFTEDKLATADLVEEVNKDGAKYVQVSGIKSVGGGKASTASILCRGANDMVVEEVSRSLHDALCVIRSLVKEPALICGGGAPEVEMSLILSRFAATLPSGAVSLSVSAFAESLLTIPTILAENAGLSPVPVVTELRNAHSQGKVNFGINVRKGCVDDMKDENVLQPLLVSTSAITLAAETVSMILKIDDVVASR